MDSTALQEQIVQLVVIVLGVATTYVLKIVRDLLKKQGEVADGKLSEQARDRLYPGLINAVAYAQSLLSGNAQEQLGASDKLKTEVVHQAATYIHTKFAETLEELGVTDQALEQMLRARLQQALDAAKILPAV